MINSTNLAFVAAVLASSANARPDKQTTCRALALSGGGNNGAWEVGVLYGMVNNEMGNAEDFAYDVVTGVSAGAINSGAIMGWEVGREVEMTHWLSDMWNTLTTADVWQDWKLGKVSGLLLMSSIVDNSPLANFLRSTLHQFDGYGRRVSVTTVNVETGEYTEFNQKNTNFYDMANACLSSGSIPAVFPPHHWPKLGYFMDGGTVWNINPESAIQQCLDLVDEESQIILDIYLCGSVPTWPTPEGEDGSTLDSILYKRALGKYYGNSDEIVTSMRAHPDVQFRYIVAQHDEVHGGMSELNFQGEFTWPAQLAGRKAASETLAGSKVHNVREHFAEWVEDKGVREEFSHVAEFVQARVAEARFAEIVEQKWDEIAGPF